MDNLENLYKKSFENFERKPKGDFWAKLEPIIPPKQEKRRDKKWLLIILCAGLFLVLGAGGWHYFLSSSEKELDTFPILFPDKIGATTTENGATELVNKFIPSVVNEDRQSNSTEIEQPEKESMSILEKVETTNEPQLTKQLEGKKIEKAKKIIPLERPKEIAEKQQDKTKKMSHNIALIPKKIALLTIKNNTLDIFKQKQKKQGKKRLAMYPFLSATYTPIGKGILLVDDLTNNTRFTELIDVQPTRGWTVNAGIQLENNWLFQIGMQQHQYQLSKRAQVAIPTRLTGTTETENNFTQQYFFRDIAITEPLEGTVTVISPKDIFREAALFFLNLDLQQLVKITSISSQVGYRFRLNTRWAFIPKVGVGIGWGSKERATLAAANLVNNRQQIAQINLSNTNVTTYNLIEGVFTPEITYRYAKRISIIAAPQFRLSFTPFFNNHERSVHHHFGQLKFGIRIHL